MQCGQQPHNHVRRPGATHRQFAGARSHACTRADQQSAGQVDIGEAPRGQCSGGQETQHGRPALPMTQAVHKGPQAVQWAKRRAAVCVCVRRSCAAKRTVNSKRKAAGLTQQEDGHHQDGSHGLWAGTPEPLAVERNGGLQRPAGEGAVFCSEACVRTTAMPWGRGLNTGRLPPSTPSAGRRCPLQPSCGAGGAADSLQPSPPPRHLSPTPAKWH